MLTSRKRKQRRKPVVLTTLLTLSSNGPYRFRKLALVYHPDRNASDTAKQDFLQICEAYDILSNREFPARIYICLSTLITIAYITLPLAMQHSEKAFWTCMESRLSKLAWLKLSQVAYARAPCHPFCSFPM